MNIVQRLGGWQGRFFVVGLITWTLWALISSLNSQYAFEPFSPYLVNPLVLVVGVTLGWYSRRSWRRGQLVQLAIVLIVVTTIVVPIYTNASAAVGYLFIALAGLAALDLRQPKEANPVEFGSQRASTPELRVLGMAIVLASLAGVGIWLVLDSQAAIVLTALIAVIITWLLWRRLAPPQWITITLGSLLSAMAAVVAIWLGSRNSWPSWLTESESLSSARHTLWSDALNLWATQPLFGAGPGSFTPSSELASEIPSLAAVHSLILQVGAELGIVGIVLLVSVFLGGLLFAARGSRPVALIAIAAWTSLAIHSSIDHLEDFPIVAFMAGIVLAWSGFSRPSSENPSQNRHARRLLRDRQG